MKTSFLLFSTFLTSLLGQEAPQNTATPMAMEPESVPEYTTTPQEITPAAEPFRRWYFEIKPGYFYFQDADMRDFFGPGGFTIRGEVGYCFYKPLLVWFDAGYFEKKGKALGGGQDLGIQIASVSLGLKAIHYFHKRFALYAGAAPRAFLMMLQNYSPFVSSQDNKISLGAAFDAGMWIFAFSKCPNLFLDLFADYTWKNMKIDPDPISSLDNDVNISGYSIGIGIGGRF